jgi:hypothetical protein
MILNDRFFQLSNGISILNSFGPQKFHRTQSAKKRLSDAQMVGKKIVELFKKFPPSMYEEFELHV